jgi:hypothetical protein
MRFTMEKNEKEIINFNITGFQPVNLSMYMINLSYFIKGISYQPIHVYLIIDSLSHIFKD